MAQTSSNQLNVILPTATQDAKVPDINQMILDVMDRICQYGTVAIDNTNAATLTQDNIAERASFEIIDGAPVPTGAITITLPTTHMGFQPWFNSTSFTATIQRSGQTSPPTIAVGEQAIFYSDGTDILKLSLSASQLNAPLDTNGNQVQWSKGADVASASALAIGTDGNIFDVTGTATITSINTVGVGTFIILQFDAAAVLTHNATDLVLPGAANITAAAGDHALLYEYATGDWICLGYFLASGEPLYSSPALTQDLDMAGFAITEGANVIMQSSGADAQLILSNGGSLDVQVATTELTGLTGATATATDLIPQGAVVLGVATRVTTTITGATDFDVGDGTTVNRWADAVALTAGTTTNNSNWLNGGAINVFTGAGGDDVVLTANGSNFTAGAVRIAVWYVDTTSLTA